MQQYDRALAAAIQEAVDAFIGVRKQDKLDKLTKEYAKKQKNCAAEAIEERNQLCLEEAEKARQIEQEYQRSTWIADAARRAGQISVVTHAVKYTHPGAKGSNFYAPASTCRDDMVCTDIFSLHEDVVGNAAALDVYKFLRQPAAGKVLFDYILADEPAFIAALGEDASIVQSWMKSFKKMREPQKQPASHTLARQVYVPLSEGGYHLLAPLFPSSLVQSFSLAMQEARFGETAKRAREACKKNETCEQGYVGYPNLLVQRYGGTKPQNISQLNSERHGENWLLSSCPPQWQSEPLLLPLRVDSVFGSFLLRRRAIRQGLKELRLFLEKTQYTNVAIRQSRADRVDGIVDDIVQWAAQLRQRAGWSKTAECRLLDVELCWLDPVRAAEDGLESAFQGAWRAEIARRFARWFNAQLKTDALHMGDDEYEAWRHVVTDALRFFEEELDYAV